MAKKPKDRTYKKASKALKKKDNKSFVISKPLSAFALVALLFNR